MITDNMATLDGVALPPQMLPSPVPAKIWPIIEVAKCEYLPCDYPGPMGVPVTFLNRIGGRNDGSSGFLIIDCIRPKCRGKDMYQRLVVVNTRFCSGLFQVYRKADGTYCTAEKLPAGQHSLRSRHAARALKKENRNDD